MNSKNIFGLALGLLDPWYVSAIRLEQLTSGKMSLHIEIDYKKGYFVNESQKSIVYDRMDRTWRH